jgi:hypothetical protein
MKPELRRTRLFKLLAVVIVAIILLLPCFIAASYVNTTKRSIWIWTYTFIIEIGPPSGSRLPDEDDVHIGSREIKGPCRYSHGASDPELALGEVELRFWDCEP